MFHKHPIRKPNRVKRIALRLEEWPDADRLLWLEALRDDDIFGKPGLAAHWRPATCRRAIAAYGRWLGELALHEPDALKTGAAERVTRKRIAWFCEILSETNTGVSVATHLRALRDTLRILAPAGDWTWLLNIAKQIDHQSVPRPKAHRIHTTDELRELGFQLMEQANAKASVRIDTFAALEYRDGLMLALLAMCPLRRSNLAGLEVGRSLISSGNIWTILLSSAETKGRRDEEHFLPADISACIDRYLQAYRPAIPGSSKHDGFWASAKSCPLPADGAYQMISRRTKDAFGIAISPHLFRDAAATTWALNAPDQIRVASDLLGHASPRTAERHYNQANSISAARRLAAAISKQRPSGSGRR